MNQNFGIRRGGGVNRPLKTKTNDQGIPGYEGIFQL